MCHTLVSNPASEIPRVDLASQWEAIREELDEAVNRVLESGRYILGPEVEALEAELAAFCGVAHCVATGSGTDAIRLALTACRVGTGSEVVTVSHTAVPTVFAIDLAGATPVFVDVDPTSHTMDVAQAASALGPASRALLPVHLYGQCADMAPLTQLGDDHGLWLIEDACQAHGARYRGQRAGAIGHVGCFSFYPTKNLGGYGDGGALVTDEETVADRVRLLRNHGLRNGYMHEVAAGNSRLDELQAAVLRVKLSHLDTWNAQRRRIANEYRDQLSGLPLVTPVEADWGEHVFHLYVIRTPRRDELLGHLRANGVDAGIHYPVPVHRQPPYSNCASPSALPVTEQLVGEVLSLPMYPELRSDQVARVTGLVREFFE